MEPEEAEQILKNIMTMAEHASTAILVLTLVVQSYDSDDDIEMARAIGEARNFILEVTSDNGS